MRCDLYWWQDLTSFVVKSVADIEKVMRVGNNNRSVGVTDMNAHSSRSHAVFVIKGADQRSGPAVLAWISAPTWLLHACSDVLRHLPKQPITAPA